MIRIDNDGVTGYQKAQEDVTEPELKALFEKYREQGNEKPAKPDEIKVL